MPRALWRRHCSPASRGTTFSTALSRGTPASIKHPVSHRPATRDRDGVRMSLPSMTHSDTGIEHLQCPAGIDLAGTTQLFTAEAAPGYGQAMAWFAANMAAGVAYAVSISRLDGGSVAVRRPACRQGLGRWMAG